MLPGGQRNRNPVDPRFVSDLPGDAWQRSRAGHVVAQKCGAAGEPDRSLMLAIVDSEAAGNVLEAGGSRDERPLPRPERRPVFDLGRGLRLEELRDGCQCICQDREAEQVVLLAVARPEPRRSELRAAGENDPVGELERDPIRPDVHRLGSENELFLMWTERRHSELRAHGFLACGGHTYTRRRPGHNRKSRTESIVTSTPGSSRASCRCGRPRTPRHPPA